MFVVVVVIVHFARGTVLALVITNAMVFTTGLLPLVKASVDPEKSALTAEKVIPHFAEVTCCWLVETLSAELLAVDVVAAFENASGAMLTIRIGSATRVMSLVAFIGIFHLTSAGSS